MSGELLILRHGKSDWHNDTDDFHRPLNRRGKQGATAVGAWLAEVGLLPEIIISSPALRARETSERACKAMALAKKCIHFDKRLYLAEAQTLVEVLQESPPSAQRIMLVGHNPGLEELLRLLVDHPIPETADAKLLPTATLARLAIPLEWANLAHGHASLLGITRASRGEIQISH